MAIESSPHCPPSWFPRHRFASARALLSTGALLAFAAIVALASEMSRLADIGRAAPFRW